tara:strand:+ start:195 stop:590 length:396 start_codon:yes stop_codon:yes gene_type:complete
MKLTKTQLKQIIKEELNAALAENIDAYGEPLALEDDTLYYVARVGDKAYLMKPRHGSSSIPDPKEPNFERTEFGPHGQPPDRAWKGDWSQASDFIKYYEIAHAVPGSGLPAPKNRARMVKVKQNKGVDNAT